MFSPCDGRRPGRLAGLWAVCLGAVAALAAGVTQVLSATATQPADKPVVLVIERMGREQVLIGRIVERSQETVTIEKPVGKPRRSGEPRPIMRISIPLENIKLICASLEELYEKKRSEIDSREPSEHLRLARWCLSHGLRDEAQAELEAVLFLEPGHEIARRMYESMTKLSGPPGTPKPRPMAKPWPVSLQHRYKRWAAAQTKESMAAFARDVQRTLVNLCGAADCHGPSFTRGHFRLQRWGPDNRFTIAKTVANLKAVFTTLDTSDYANSLLLLAPQRTKDEPPIHPGGQVFVKEKKRLYPVVRDWVMGLKPPLPKPGERVPTEATKEPRRSDRRK